MIPGNDVREEKAMGKPRASGDDPGTGFSASVSPA